MPLHTLLSIIIGVLALLTITLILGLTDAHQKLKAYRTMLRDTEQCLETAQIERDDMKSAHAGAVAEMVDLNRQNRQLEKQLVAQREIVSELKKENMRLLELNPTYQRVPPADPDPTLYDAVLKLHNDCGGTTASFANMNAAGMLYRVSEVLRVRGIV